MEEGHSYRGKGRKREVMTNRRFNGIEHRLHLHSYTTLVYLIHGAQHGQVQLLLKGKGKSRIVTGQ